MRAASLTTENSKAASPLTAAEVVRIEAAALEALATRLEGPEHEALERMLARLAAVLERGGRIVLSGMGKSGLIARKIAATMVSLGIRASFLHPAEALHGDLGTLAAGDALLALSYSGETEELLRLLPVLSRMGVAVLSFCGCGDSTLARGSQALLDVSVEREACHHQLAPTASTTAMLALGDALAVDLSRRLGFVPQSFAELHPGGHLGRRLTAVSDVMHTGEAVPVVAPEAALPEIVHEMSAKRLGMTTVQQGGRLLGLISDGDLRRLMERVGPEAFGKTAAEVMHAQPRTIAASTFLSAAVDLMGEHKITSLVVTASGGAAEEVLGLVHMHDLLKSLGAGRVVG